MASKRISKELKDLQRYPPTSCSVCNSPRDGPFTSEELDEICNKLALYITDNCDLE